MLSPQDARWLQLLCVVCEHLLVPRDDTTPGHPHHRSQKSAARDSNQSFPLGPWFRQKPACSLNTDWLCIIQLHCIAAFICMLIWTI